MGLLSKRRRDEGDKGFKLPASSAITQLAGIALKDAKEIRQSKRHEKTHRDMEESGVFILGACLGRVWVRGWAC